MTTPTARRRPSNNVRKLVESDEVLVVFSALGTPSNTAIQEISEHQEGAATVRRHRRTKWNDPTHFSVDHRMLPAIRAKRASTRNS
jgi:hypothetical protein